ncbi:MAG TPA: hypothetical protein VFR81_26265 [Longimicrobium sp.]|nr:hypothetical protein [Longimicrobium sp.]
MRALVISTLSILLLTVPVCAQPGRSGLLRRYDKLEECTTVNASVFRHGPARATRLFTFDAQAMHRDTAPPPEPIREATFTFGIEYGTDEGDFDHDDHALSLVVDDSVVLRYPGRHARPFPARHVRGGTHERVYVRVPAADLRRIARATTVRGKIEQRAFTLDAARIATLRQLADFMARSPGAPIPVPGEFDSMDCDSYPWSPNHPPYEPETDDAPAARSRGQISLREEPVTWAW